MCEIKATRKLLWHPKGKVWYKHNSDKKLGKKKAYSASELAKIYAYFPGMKTMGIYQQPAGAEASCVGH